MSNRFGSWRHLDPILTTTSNAAGTTVYTSASLHRAASIISPFLFAPRASLSLNIPTHQMLQHTKDAIEDLDSEEWRSFLAREPRGLEAYSEKLKAHLENWANQPSLGPRPSYRTGSRTARSTNISAYTGPRRRKMASARDPARKAAAPLCLVFRRESSASGVPPTSSPPIFVGIPDTIDYPLQTSLHTLDGELTLKKDAMSRFVASLAPLAPILDAVLTQPLGGADGVTEALICEQAEDILTKAYSTTPS